MKNRFTHVFVELPIAGCLAKSGYRQQRHSLGGDTPARLYEESAAQSYTHTYIYIYIYIYIYQRLGVLVDPNWETGFGSGAMRCGCDALRCDRVAMRCDAMRCEAVRACEGRRDSPGWCFQWALTVVCHGLLWRAVAWLAVASSPLG